MNQAAKPHFGTLGAYHRPNAQGHRKHFGWTILFQDLGLETRMPYLSSGPCVRNTGRTISLYTWYSSTWKRRMIQCPVRYYGDACGYVIIYMWSWAGYLVVTMCLKPHYQAIIEPESLLHEASQRPLLSYHYYNKCMESVDGSASAWQASSGGALQWCRLVHRRACGCRRAERRG